MKPIIGILPKGLLFDPAEDSTFDLYHLGNNYTRQVQMAGATPICLAPVDGYISPEQLELCDGFLIQGGRKMWPYHFQTVHHAFSTGKRCLGVCLGMQLIHRYYRLRRLASEQGLELTEATLLSMVFEQGLERDALGSVEGHRIGGMTRQDTEPVKHSVSVVPGTQLHRLLGKEEIRAASFHNFRAVSPTQELTVNAWAPDGTIEGVENGSNLLGVQFHPEVDDRLPQLFRFLTDPE